MDCLIGSYLDISYPDNPHKYCQGVTARYLEYTTCPTPNPAAILYWTGNNFDISNGVKVKITAKKKKRFLLPDRTDLEIKIKGSWMNELKGMPKLG